jgi:predicted transposase
MAGKKAEKGDVLYLGVHARLVFPDPRDEEAVLDLMRRFSSATRYAYRRLLEGKPREELKRADGPLRKLFRLNTRYADGAIAKAKAVLDSALELGNDPKKVIFGGRGLFEQLKRKHLSGKDRERLKRRWKEKRRGLLYTRGDRSKKGGNPHFKLQVEGGGLWLLVHLGEEEGKEEGERKKFARALVKTSHPQLNALLERIHTGLPYNAELTLKEGKVYAQFTWSEELPPPVHTRANGVLGIDVNSDPYHLALAVVSPDGNLKRHLTLSLEEVDRAPNKGAKELALWKVAHQVVAVAEEHGVAIATERLKRLRKSRRGDGSGRALSPQTAPLRLPVPLGEDPLPRPKAGRGGPGGEPPGHLHDRDAQVRPPASPLQGRGRRLRHRPQGLGLRGEAPQGLPGPPPKQKLLRVHRGVLREAASRNFKSSKRPRGAPTPGGGFPGTSGRLRPL